MGVVNGKQWGETEPILENDRIQIHRINIVAGGQCSKHRHQSRWNLFYVVRGTISVSAWKEDQSLVDETTLGEGQFTTVKPGEWHQFYAHEDSEVLEIYYPAALSADDIERELVVKRSKRAR